MPVTYIVEQGSSAIGPWVAVSGSPVSTITDTVTGLLPGTTYWFRITAQDTAIGLAAIPTVFGPITTTASGSGDIVINPIPTAASAPFTVTGQLSGFSSAPSLSYADDPSLPAVTGIGETPSQTAISLTWTADVDPTLTPLVGTVTTTSFSFVHPAMAGGTHTLLVTNGALTGQTTYAVTGSGGGGGSVTAWNPADADVRMTISGAGNLVATVTTAVVSGGVTTSVRSTTSRTTGKLICEIMGTAQDSSFEAGFANATMSLAIFDGMGADINGVGVNLDGGDQGVEFNNTKIIPSGGNTEPATNCPVTLCFDIPNLLFWYTTPGMRSRLGATAWNNSATASPATGVGGSLLTGFTGPYFICFNAYQSGNIATLNAVGPFAVPIPAGFTAWDSVAGTPAIANASVSGDILPNTPVTVTGALSNYASPPVIQYQVTDVLRSIVGAWVTAGSGASTTTFTVTLPANLFANPSAYTIAVRDAAIITNTATTNMFNAANGSVDSLGLVPIAGFSGNPVAHAINIVIMGDGFTSAQGAAFLTGATAKANEVYVASPYFNHTNKINFYALYVDSTQSGTSGDVAGGTPGTILSYFGTTISTNVAEESTTTVFPQYPGFAQILATRYLPSWTVAVVLTNSLVLGGSSLLDVTCVTLEGSGPQGMVNPADSFGGALSYELGHSAFTLADEFGTNGSAIWPGGPAFNTFGGPPINVISSQSEMNPLWVSLLTPGIALPSNANPDCTNPFYNGPDAAQGAFDVGMFEGGLYYNCGTWHSQTSCTMRQGTGIPYCPVCYYTILNTLANV